MKDVYEYLQGCYEVAIVHNEAFKTRIRHLSEVTCEV